MQAYLLGDAHGGVQARESRAGLAGEERAGGDERWQQHQQSDETGLSLASRQLFLGRGGMNGTVWAGVMAEHAVDAGVRSDAHRPARQRRQQPQQRAVGTEEAAVGPAHHGGDEQHADADGEHDGGTAEAEEEHEGVVFTDEEGAAGGGKEHGYAQIDERQHAECVFQPVRQFDRPQQHYFLRRPQRAHRRAEDTPDHQREKQRQQKEQADGDRQREAGVGNRQRDVLHRPHRADAAVAIEAEVE
ncbi:MAG: hypothetical protein BWY76_02125 [bacterium ADurb.Bin429]|nr:MAG: hypothetical protein BWY76_02125 [bacterium ADurb.Bin429]